MVARRAHNPEAVGSNPAPATKKSHPRQNASGLLIPTYPSDCNGSGDLPPVQVSAARCTQIALKPVYVQLRLDIKNKMALLKMLGWRILQGFQSLFHFLKKRCFHRLLREYPTDSLL